MGNDAAAIDAFIARWQGREGGQERANYSMFLTEFCRVLGLPIPDPAGATTEDNDYVFERAVKDFLPDGSAASRRIDLYKRGSFVLEAKQVYADFSGQGKNYAQFPDRQSVGIYHEDYTAIVNTAALPPSPFPAGDDVVQASCHRMH
jgi:hypothetical protein